MQKKILKEDIICKYSDNVTWIWNQRHQMNENYNNKKRTESDMFITRYNVHSHNAHES